ncbi:MAG: alkaline phosphatase family protein [Actinomycetota bacterium]
MNRKLAIGIALLLAVAVGAFFTFGDQEEPSPATELSDEDRTFGSNDWMERACALPEEQLVRIQRGHHPVHSEDVTIVPLPPNYSGSFGVTSHSGPWDYLQNVPLVLYGPPHVNAAGVLEGEVSITDVYPTVGHMTGVDLPARTGKILREAVTQKGTRPRLIVTIVWDGVGRNVLERFAGRWPVLERLEREGTSYIDAVVGSSPSITPATHASLGTGSYPADHAVTAIEYRAGDGKVRGVLPGKDPSDLKLTTYADEIDRALGNESLVGMLAWKNWQMGMMGHGRATEGGDADHLALVTGHKGFSGNDAYYSTPEYLKEFPGLEQRAEELDRADGEADGKWLGHEVLAQHDNPAWVNWQTDGILEMLEREGYGSDAVPDLFFINYKPTDIVGHQHNMDSEEMGEVLESQDAALGRLIDFLDEKVKDYVVILTSDHGNTPPPTRSGAWPVLQGQLQASVDAHFEVPDGQSLIRSTSAVGPFLNNKVAKNLGVTAADVAEFLNGYTLRENYKEEELPAGYEDRGGENILAAAFPSDRIDAILRCARTP